MIASGSFGVWEGLVTGTSDVDENGHDARLVAAMTVPGLTHLLTFNAQLRQRSSDDPGTGSCTHRCAVG
jgi:hypothetical protein